MVVFPKEDFIEVDKKVHLATGGQPPLLRAHQQAFDTFARDKSNGMAGYDRHWDICDEVRRLLSRHTGLPAADHALLGNASEGIARAVSSIDWQPGDSVVASALDYASGKYTLIRLRQAGVDVHLVPPDGTFIDTQALLQACTANTRLIYISQVNAHTGQRIDLSALSQACRTRGIALLVDASHAMGAIPLDGQLCDFIVASTYKFLLGTHMGVFAWNSAAWPRFEPQQVGWHSAAPGTSSHTYDLLPDARRVEIGNANHLDVYLLQASLNYLAQTPPARLSSHIAALSETLYTGYQGLGLDILTPADPQARGPNISFHHANPRALADQAAADDILLWGESGRVRASLHGFVSRGDVHRYLDWLEENHHCLGLPPRP